MHHHSCRRKKNTSITILLPLSFMVSPLAPNMLPQSSYSSTQKHRFKFIMEELREKNIQQNLCLLSQVHDIVYLCTHTRIQVEPDCICANARKHQHGMISLWTLQMSTQSCQFHSSSSNHCSIMKSNP